MLQIREILKILNILKLFAVRKKDYGGPNPHERSRLFRLVGLLKVHIFTFVYRGSNSRLFRRRDYGGFVGELRRNCFAGAIRNISEIKKIAPIFYYADSYFNYYSLLRLSTSRNFG